MNEAQPQPYLNLIQQLLSASKGKRNSILQDQLDLIDETCLNAMVVYSKQLEEEGKETESELLREIATQLAEFIGVDLSVVNSPQVSKAEEKNPIFESDKVLPVSGVQPNRQDYIAFLQQTLQLIAENKGNPKVIYPYWQQHQHLLDQNFAQVLTNWYHSVLLSADNQTKLYLATILGGLGDLINQFPLGKRRVNLEIGIACYQDSLKIYTKDTFPYEWANTQNNLAIAYRNRIEGERRQNLEMAIACYLESLTIRTPKSYPLDCLQTARNLGYLGFKEGNWHLAIEGYSIAIEAVENIRSQAISEIRRQEIMSEAIEVYFNIVQSYINLEQIDKAIEYVERSKTRDLVELLANRDLYPKGNIPPTVIKELDRLRREIVTEGKQLANQESNQKNNLITENQQDQLQPKRRDYSKLNQLQQELDKLIQEKITPEDPTFSLTQKVETISFAQIQNLTDKNTAIIQWYITADKILTFIITANSKQPIIQQSSFEDLEALIDQFNNYLKLYSSDNKQWQLQLDSFLEKFAQHLHLDEIVAQIPNNYKSLILIPHRFLHLLPIHALPTTKVPPFLRGARGDKTVILSEVKEEQTPILEEKKYMMDLFPNGIKYAPSCQLLQMVKQQQRKDFDSLFAVQNPTRDLIYADLEVEKIRTFFPKAEVLVKEKAHETAIKIHEYLPLANCVHFSCHGTFNPNSPLESALILTTDQTDSNNQEDGKLTLEEIFNLNLTQCRLVSLSACETGLTDFNSRSDEYIGLPSGFLFAGSTNVISSLWAVNDLSTAILMIKFYETFKQNKNVSLTLTQAQYWLRNLINQEFEELLERIKPELDQVLAQLRIGQRLMIKELIKQIKQRGEKPFANPYYWAAFAGIGV